MVRGQEGEAQEQDLEDVSVFCKFRTERECWLLIRADYLDAIEEVVDKLTLSPVLLAAAEQLSGGSGLQGAAGQPLSHQASGWSWHGGLPAGQ